MVCRDRCEPYRFKKPLSKGVYINGGKKCRMCDIYIEYSGLRCPCCNYMLHSFPKAKRGRRKLVENKSRMKLKILAEKLLVAARV